MLTAAEACPALSHCPQLDEHIHRNATITGYDYHRDRRKNRGHFTDYESTYHIFFCFSNHFAHWYQSSNLSPPLTSQCSTAYMHINFIPLVDGAYIAIRCKLMQNTELRNKPCELIATIWALYHPASQIVHRCFSGNAQFLRRMREAMQKVFALDKNVPAYVATYLDHVIRQKIAEHLSEEELQEQLMIAKHLFKWLEA
eukprot:gene24271-1549_t